jgi:hypothetical protein
MRGRTAILATISKLQTKGESSHKIMENLQWVSGHSFADHTAGFGRHKFTKVLVTLVNPLPFAQLMRGVYTHRAAHYSFQS